MISKTRPLIRRRSFWLVTIAIWSFFGLMVANQLYFSMRGHGHHWWRIVVWQMVGACTWMALSPLVFSLKSLFPFDGPRRFLSPLVHGTAAVAAGLLRMIPMTAVSLALDPYRPVPTESSFVAEYRVLVSHWLAMDLFIYGTILAVAYAYDYRRQRHRDQLRAAHLERELVNAELRALKLELQPHFLFNTMNSIVSMIRTGTDKRAEEMLLGLCKLLRSTLDDQRRQRARLEEEINVTEIYLDIQRIRFGERLNFQWHIEAGTEQAEVPALLLQPLIENAVRHAVELGSGWGTIDVKVSRCDDHLLIDVEDDGPGDGESKATTLNADLSAPPSRGLGLENVRGRLAALYGEDWSLQLTPRPEGGTRVSLSFPWHPPQLQTQA